MRMIKFQNILHEMVVSSLPREDKLIRWFLDRIDHTFVFFDVETTGLNRTSESGDENQLTQIGAIATNLNGETLRFFELGRFNIGVRLNDNVKQLMMNEPDAPEDETSPEYKKWLKRTKKGILRYNHYDLANSESYEEERAALEKFDNFLKEYSNVTLIAHNAPFDLKWIQFHEIFKESTDEIIDSLDFFRNYFFPTLEKLSNESDRYKSTYDNFEYSVDRKTGEYTNKKSSGLESLAKGFNDEVNQLKAKLSGAHEAVTDCEITIEVLERGLLMVRSHLGK